MFFETAVWHVNRVQPSGHYMYRQFNVHKLYVLPTQCVYVFCVDMRTNSDYFTVQFFLLVYGINSFSKTAPKAKTRARKIHFPFLATL